MPCLNEAETLADCIREARQFLRSRAIQGEIVIADNGSTDGSQEIARSNGARLVEVELRGYGSALRGGIKAARGKYVIMGDADYSYDFSRLDAFVAKLREGVPLVVGNRFAGGIEPGAMPFLHRYLGNPVLSWLGRLFYGLSVGDFYCGLRGFSRDQIANLPIAAKGMEFASEMIVQASLAGLVIKEAPTTLRRDRRNRPPHLQTWRDGWRGLRFLLLLSPRWLFIYPGIFLTVVGMLLSVALFYGPVEVVPGVRLDLHSFVVGCFSAMIGAQALSFGLVAQSYAATNLHELKGAGKRAAQAGVKLEVALLASAVLVLLGVAGFLSCIWQWYVLDFGNLDYGDLFRRLTISSTLIVLGLQIAFTSFLVTLVSREKFE
jgi:hypothetical protein